MFEYLLEHRKQKGAEKNIHAMPLDVLFLYIINKIIE